ncbi:MAG: 3-oxoacyl-ACP reductase family protein [Actinomycetota bacterium]
MTSPLAGKRAVVTGGSRGIGAGIVRRLVADGADVAFTYQSSAQPAQDLADELGGTGSKVVALQADSADPTAVADAVQAAASALGGLDILVNNAGIAYGAPIEDFPLEEFDRLIAVNVRGVFAATKAVVPHLGQGGRIITIGSVNADRAPMAALSGYALTKAAVAGFTRGLVRELGPRGITVNTIQPGPVATDMNPEHGGDFSDQVRPFIAVGRYGQPADIASAVAYLASPEASYVTGVTWNIDGGFAI